MKTLRAAAVLISMHSALLAINAVVSRPVADMHSAAREDADVVSQAVFGLNLEILEERDSWARVRTPDNYTGWMDRAGLFPSSTPYAAQDALEVTSLFANLYREPSITKHKPLMTLPFESRLEPAGEPKAGERWREVRLPDDRRSWVLAGDVSAPAKPLTVSQMIAFSRKFLGLPYLWGGTSTFGFDCSGFTQMLCRRRGIIMPRDASLQADWEGMSKVSRKALRRGDLLFFGPSQDNITHTGLYIGKGKFINATTHETPVIQVNKLSDPHWTKIFVCARRVK